MKEDIKLSCVFVGGNSENKWLIRAEHDVTNGSAIRASGETLPKALEALAKQIRSTQLKDPIWSKVTGD